MPLWHFNNFLQIDPFHLGITFISIFNLYCVCGCFCLFILYFILFSLSILPKVNLNKLFSETAFVYIIISVFILHFFLFCFFKFVLPLSLQRLELIYLFNFYFLIYLSAAVYLNLDIVLI